MMFERDENSNEKPRQLGRGKVADIARIGRIEFSVEPNTLPGWQNLHATHFPFVSAQKTQLTKPLPPPPPACTSLTGVSPLSATKPSLTKPGSLSLAAFALRSGARETIARFIRGTSQTDPKRKEPQHGINHPLFIATARR